MIEERDRRSERIGNKTDGRKREMETLKEKVWNRREGKRQKKVREMRKDGAYAEKVGRNMKMNRVRERRRMRHIRQRIEIEQTEKKMWKKARQ